MLYHHAMRDYFIHFKKPAEVERTDAVLLEDLDRRMDAFKRGEKAPSNGELQNINAERRKALETAANEIRADLRALGIQEVTLVPFEGFQMLVSAEPESIATLEQQRVAGKFSVIQSIENCLSFEELTSELENV